MRALHDHERPPSLAAAAPTRRAWRSPPTCRRPADARTLPARLIATLLLVPIPLRSKYIVIHLAAHLRASSTQIVDRDLVREAPILRRSATTIRRRRTPPSVTVISGTDSVQSIRSASVQASVCGFGNSRCAQL